MLVSAVSAPTWTHTLRRNRGHWSERVTSAHTQTPLFMSTPIYTGGMGMDTKTIGLALLGRGVTLVGSALLDRVHSLLDRMHSAGRCAQAAADMLGMMCLRPGSDGDVRLPTPQGQCAGSCSRRRIVWHVSADCAAGAMASERRCMLLEDCGMDASGQSVVTRKNDDVDDGGGGGRHGDHHDEAAPTRAIHTHTDDDDDDGDDENGDDGGEKWRC
eukprot:3855647-Rhodomonas_salina.1